MVSTTPNVLSVSQNQRTKEVDYLKGIAIIFVIGIHAFGISPPAIFMQNRMLWLLNFFIAVLVSSAVPLFIFASGFILYQRYHGEISLKSFYTKRCVAIVPPYLIFSLLYTFVSGRFYLKAILGDIVQGTSSFHLYFIPLLLQLYLLYPALQKLFMFFQRKKITGFLLIFAALIQIVFNSVFWLGLTNPDFAPIARIASHFCLGLIFYFVFGMYSASVNRSTKKSTYTNPAILIPALLVLISIKIIFTPPAYAVFREMILINGTVGIALLLSIVAILISLLTFEVSRRTANAFSHNASLLTQTILTMGQNSYALYLIHILFLMVSLFILDIFKIGSLNWFRAPLNFVGTLLMSTLVVLNLRKLPWGKTFFGTS